MVAMLMASINIYNYIIVGRWVRDREAVWKDFAHLFLTHFSHSMNENYKSKQKNLSSGRITRLYIKRNLTQDLKNTSLENKEIRER